MDGNVYMLSLCVHIKASSHLGKSFPPFPLSMSICVLVKWLRHKSPSRREFEGHTYKRMTTRARTAYLSVYVCVYGCSERHTFRQRTNLHNSSQPLSGWFVDRIVRVLRISTVCAQMRTGCVFVCVRCHWMIDTLTRSHYSSMFNTYTHFTRGLTSFILISRWDWQRLTDSYMDWKNNKFYDMNMRNFMNLENQ